MLTREQKKAAKAAYKAVQYYDEACEELFSDPMTDAMGAPTGDICQGFERTAHRLINKAAENPHNTEEVRRMLFDAQWELCERYTP